MAAKDPGPAIAVVAATAAEARDAAAALPLRTPGSRLVPAALAAYLGDPAAPARIVLCATRGPAGRGLAFLTRASARLLWPAPPADIDAAIGGLRDADHAPRRGGTARGGRLRAALLLEGPVDAFRTRAAFAAVENAGPRDWIVESARHVRLSGPRLAALARAGVRWSALEPVELVAVYAGAAVARSLRGRAWLPRRTPVWITPGRALR
jgi:hypothetical protein